MLFHSGEIKDEMVYVTGTTASNTPPHYFKSLLGKIGSDGIPYYFNLIIDSTKFSYSNYNNSLRSSVDGNFLTIGDFIDTANKVFIMKIDTQGQIKLWHEYNYPGAVIFQGNDIIEMPDSGYILIINLATGNDNNILIVRTDTLGNILSQKIYNSGYAEIPVAIRRMMNGHFMVAAYKGKINGFTPYFLLLIEIDSRGNIMSEWTDTTTYHIPHGIQQAADSGWVIVGQHMSYDQNNIQLSNGSILKLDKNFKKQWEIDTGENDFNAGMFDVEISNTGDYICAGAGLIYSEDDSLHSFGLIMKVSPEGDIKWERSFLADTNTGTYSAIYDVDILPNGDLIGFGDLTFVIDVGIKPVQQGWILRTNSEGCLVDQCLSGIEDITSTKTLNVTISPDPFTTDIAIGIQKEGLKEVTYTITNLLGQPVYTHKEQNLTATYTKMLDLSYLPKGIYFVEVVVDGERVVREVVKTNGQ